MRADSGFTLVEVIAGLIVLGLVGAVGAMGLSQAVQGYVFAVENVSESLAVEAAVSRMSVDISQLYYNPPANVNPPTDDPSINPSTVNNPKHDPSLTVGYQVSASSATGITLNALFQEVDPDPTVMPATTTVAYSYNAGTDQVLVGGNLLLEDVTAFQIQYLDSAGTPSASFNTTLPGGTKAIDVSMTVDVNGVSKNYTTRIVPRLGQ